MAFLSLVAGLFQGGIKEVRFRLYYGPVFHRFLNHKYSFYTKLPWSLKLKFLRLVRDHYEYFQFVPREGMKLTRAMNAIICSAASQIVLFLPKESLTFFEKILVYPDYYNSMITHKRHKGEVNPALHLIVFSWRGIEEGIDRPDDGLNLLLHEFAHALWLEHKLTNYEYTVLDDELVNQFELLAEAEMNSLRNNENHFFRRYAFENIEEFFAVAVENFFERSEQFSRELPHLYNAIAKILHQNPLQLATQSR